MNNISPYSSQRQKEETAHTPTNYRPTELRINIQQPTSYVTGQMNVVAREILYNDANCQDIVIISQSIKFNERNLSQDKEDF